jgi:hypothetical protein
MTSATYRVEPQPVAADRVLPGLFEDDDDGSQEPVLDLLFPIEEGVVEVEWSPVPEPTAALRALTPLVTPQAIVVPIAAVPRPAPRALVVFAAYALLGAAIVLFAGALRWTRSERVIAATAPTSVTSPSEPIRVVGPDAGAPRRAEPQATASPATSSMRVISAPGPTRIGGPQ